MPVLRTLTEDEQRLLLHKIRNSTRKGNDNSSESLLNEMTFQKVEQMLANLSEEENYNMKNRYRL
jgi:Mg/Co/Ni transporter MgtE